MTVPCSLAFATDASAILDEAEDYLTVNPAQTLSLLESFNTADKLPLEQVLRRHVLVLRAAVPTSKMDLLLQTLELVFQHEQQPYFQQQLTSINSALGIWLRRNQYLHDAQLSFECSYKYATTDKQRLTLTNSMALVARQLNDTEKARELFSHALMLAKQSEQTNVVAMVENNLGLLALDAGKFALAEAHLREALKHYQSISQRAGQISAGTNLLASFLLQQQFDNFQGLYGPTATLAASFPNESKQALLFWLDTRFQQQHGTVVTTEQRLALLEAYDKLEDDKVRTLIYHHVASYLGVNVALPQPPINKVFERPWFQLVKQCEWPHAS
ncbi:tetratricopeptide repeat protein [Rheinheimera baltica]|uniref:Tetratricopeptide repeat protein n=1 Tax=Rheinheimera baltica TaxID=67576 RepID=A0ABT9HZ89_9GAMM|nr:tetratricopeptide repeat protein [Rheinheimera baltica]MDP5136444.1 tetratricopeptide repeat protein [Rheinheimera baltica]MDP5143858.1 tetratricopeptide repeat protein [Rheinheimera baltica]MDP5151714.1 tetratricopeptide repeat protein [Rheinheimera baltica]